MKHLVIIASLLIVFIAHPVEAVLDDRWVYTDEGLHGLPAIQIENFKEDNNEPTFRLGINCVSDSDYTIDLFTEGLFEENQEVPKVYYFFYGRGKNLEDYFEFVGKENNQYHFQLPNEKRILLIQGFNEYGVFLDTKSIRFEVNDSSFKLRTHENWYEIGIPLAETCGEITKVNKSPYDIEMSAIYSFIFASFFLFVALILTIVRFFVTKKFIGYSKAFDYLMIMLVFLFLGLSIWWFFESWYIFNIYYSERGW